MCGIAGSVTKNLIDENVIKKTLFLMKNRGPDNQSYQRIKSKYNYSFLHSRLSIQDLDSRSNQPFNYKNKILVFNGEIYNFIELKKKLKNKGYIFSTKSDTEVIIKMFDCYGEKSVEFFEGMWAFVIFDTKSKSLFLSRDRFGEKPIFYYKTDYGFYFASDVSFISSLAEKKFSINMRKIERFLVNGYRSLNKFNDNFFEDINELDPGQNCFLDSDLNFKKKKYWNLKYQPVRRGISTYKNKVKSLLLDSLNLRLRSDVPLAFCLSGGVDSVTLACLTTKKLNKDICTFSIIDKEDSRYNEQDNINLISKELKSEHKNIYVSKNNFFERMKKITKNFGSPVPTISYYVHNFLSHEISSSGFKVAISGTGADEIFSGYYDHYNYWLNGMKNKKEFITLQEEWSNGSGRYINNELIKKLSNFLGDSEFFEHLYQNNSIFNNLLNQPINLEFTQKGFCKDLLRNRMLNELFFEIVPVILEADDRNSMMYSVENRSPFLDKNLVEYLYQIPSKFLIKNGYTKWFLREIGNGLVPDQVRLDKRKTGFNASIYSLLDLHNSDNKKWLLSDSPIYEIVNRRKIKDFLENNFTDNSFSKFLFSFISSKIFLEQFS